MYKNLIIWSGGVKIFYFLGALKYLDEHNLLKNINTFIGSWCGSVISALLILGYSIDEINNLLLESEDDFKNMYNKFSIFFLLNHFSLHNNYKIIKWIMKIIKKKTDNVNITLKEIYEKYNKKLYISVFNINKWEIEYLNINDNPN